MTAVILLHAAVALAVGLAGRGLGRRVLLLGAVAPAAGLAVTVWRTAVGAGETWTEQLPWAEQLGLTITLRLDGFGLLFWWLITGIGLLVFLYAFRYFSDRRDLGLFTAMLVSFAGAMLLLVSADNLLVVFVAWELTSITSYLLIGFKDTDPVARASALQALLVTGSGGLALMGGIVLLGQAAGTYSLAAIVAQMPSGASAEVGLALILLGAFTKSAQVPFHFWLPGAMAAPTPVSAYLHSATMVKGGVYLVARLSPAAAGEVSWWIPVVLAVGGTTMLLGGWRALRSTDLKSLLAFGTVSQLGFMILLLGAGDPELTFAGVAMILAHALFKATLFLTVGVVDHQAGTRDVRRLDGLTRRMPITAASAAIATASMVGLFPLLGFVSKEAALEASLHAGIGVWAVTAVIVLGSVLTTAYGLRLLWGAFATKSPDDLVAEAPEPESVPRPQLSFELPAVVLVVATVVAGLWVSPADHLVVGASRALDPAAGEYHLALWHGLGLPLLLSVIALVGGYVVYRARGTVARVGALTARAPDTTAGYRRSLFGLNRIADVVTSVVQPGSLPFYGGVVLLTVLVLPGFEVARGWEAPPDLIFADSPMQVVAGAAAIACAIAAVRIRRRLGAVLLLGGVGFSVALLFILQGAPDLALTQLLVETLSLAIFVVVLRRLPEHFDHVPWRLGQGLRLGIAVLVGMFTTGFALWAASGERSRQVSDELLARALPEGGGSNVVNVILTDFRGFDTMGEITVLVVAAIGVAALVRPVDRNPTVQTEVGHEPPPDTTTRHTADRPTDTDGAAGDRT